jgi:UDP-N-acetylmuramoyl-L-alanyl-D-glutamate--2,6-diaminopimelate ligase
MEVSSHALAQRRVEGLEFQMAVFTNLTQDHLDYHGTMKEYFRAKKILFDGLGPSAHAVTNTDDPNGRAIVDGCAAGVISYAIVADADVRARNLDMTIDGVRVLIEERGMRTAIRSQLTGRFNVSNILAAYAVGRGLGIPPETIARGIGLVKSVQGRFEQIVAPEGWTAVIDYAHTPDALENCLTTIHDIAGAERQGRVITIFGCGGNRDPGKRPLMGAIASRLSDVVVLTSDNPRDEDPEQIVDQIAGGLVAGPEVRKEPDRRKAILLGLSMARRGDVVLIAGKGHETYQIVRGTRTHFSDREEVQDYINRHG